MTEITAIDLRSDTVTRPCKGMLDAMFAAQVGDDQYREDPAMNALEIRMAAMLGKEASLWLPSGTMANQVALRIFTRPGDDVVVSRECHAVWHETGGSAANSGVQLTDIGEKGIFTAIEFEAVIKPRNHVIYPPTTLVQIENTHNRAGGVVFPQIDIEAICALAKDRGIGSYLDGARLWNASIVTGKSVAELAAPFDAVMVSLSKGLGAPGGSILAGSKDFIRQAIRYRRMFGGAMRQIGYFAAAAEYALDHNLARLGEDHKNASLLANALSQNPFIHFDQASVQSNVLVFHLKEGALAAAALVKQARQQGVYLNMFGPQTLRALTHLDVNAEQCRIAAEIINSIVSGK
ncbi:MAG: aminotransferase class I/II-fold pyridoxal phosphate-dependent enzyme [Cohaesibacteraceae bacterium]|nr:aminotransferase class I/II-fold pyridoxal phosphate-dependent enzyme [Cohaesibacteraceae bacterium]